VFQTLPRPSQTSIWPPRLKQAKQASLAIQGYLEVAYGLKRKGSLAEQPYMTQIASPGPQIGLSRGLPGVSGGVLGGS